MRKAVQKEQREESILLSLKKLDYLSRSQLQVLHELGSDRNACKVLKRMNDYLQSFRDGETIYYLSKEGRERVGCEKIRKKTTQVRHYIMRNDLYMAFQCPSTWKNEMKLEVPGKVRVIADALFQIDSRYHIVEVDHTQKMTVNRGKIQKYRKLLEIGVFKEAPKFIWITTTDYRRKQLQNLCEGLDVQIFTVQDFH